MNETYNLIRLALERQGIQIQPYNEIVGIQQKRQEQYEIRKQFTEDEIRQAKLNQSLEHEMLGKVRSNYNKTGIIGGFYKDVAWEIGYGELGLSSTVEPRTDKEIRYGLHDSELRLYVFRDLEAKLRFEEIKEMNRRALSKKNLEGKPHKTDSGGIIEMVGIPVVTHNLQWIRIHALINQVLKADITGTVYLALDEPVEYGQLYLKILRKQR